MFIVSAPGKLMLSGEWSVLEKQVPCIVLAVEQRIFVTIKLAEATKITLEDFDITTTAQIKKDKLVFENADDRPLFTQFAIETALKYLLANKVPIKNFELSTRADIISLVNPINGQKMKIGFGSSAAAVVSIIGAVLAIHEVITLSSLNKDLIFKLAIIAHYFGQGKIGSGFDVAASTFGGALVYKRFDPDWLQQELDNKDLLNVIDEDWPFLEYRNITLPKNLELMVGFTGTSASTRKLVKQMRIFKDNDPINYMQIINNIKQVTEKLVSTIEKKDESAILSLLDKNRLLLEELSITCSCHLEIKAHQIMSQIAAKYGAVAKFSGAGGGDCSVGVCFNKKIAEIVLHEWKLQNITPIDIAISPEGILIEKTRL